LKLKLFSLFVPKYLRIVDEKEAVNKIIYDISSKQPMAIGW